MVIRPVSDLRNNFPEVEQQVHEQSPVFLTKNGYGTMVLLSIEEYENLIDDVELRLDEADVAASLSDVRFSHKDVFSRIRARL